MNSDLPSSTETGANQSPRTFEDRFDWPVCYEAENFVLARIDSFLKRHPFAARLSDRMQSETGTLFIDWVDHLVLPGEKAAELEKAGFVPDPLDEGKIACWHPEALLPRILPSAESKDGERLAIKVENLEDFLAAHRLNTPIDGERLGRYRRVTVVAGDARLEVVERRGYRGYEVDRKSDSARVLNALEEWRKRSRRLDDEAMGFSEAKRILRGIIDRVGRDLACHVVFQVEREFWESRNRAARIQKRRQDRLGLGWANHDHHTFRSSRRHFVDLMEIWEMLGFERRERYYAGAQAGWGAQILEQPMEGIVAFCDVDLEPDETGIDFSRERLDSSSRLGTIGLWVGLHGESFLEAGMHHLECRFDHTGLREQLSAEGITTMKPFSDFSFLRQAFTEGEWWPVRRERVERLRQVGLIDAGQLEKFCREGAVGSHLENLQRKGGFKGFNQKSVSAIIHATDPRLVEGTEKS